MARLGAAGHASFHPAQNALFIMTPQNDPESVATGTGQSALAPTSVYLFQRSRDQI